MKDLQWCSIKSNSTLFFGKPPFSPKNLEKERIGPENFSNFSKNNKKSKEKSGNDRKKPEIIGKVRKSLKFQIQVINDLLNIFFIIFQIFIFFIVKF